MIRRRQSQRMNRSRVSFAISVATGEAVTSRHLCHPGRNVELKEQEKVVEYMQLENHVLREKLAGKRVLLNDDQRRLLAVKGKALGREKLGKIATIAQADRILRWHREFIEPRGDFIASRHMGRVRPRYSANAKIRVKRDLPLASNSC